MRFSVRSSSHFYVFFWKQWQEYKREGNLIWPLLIDHVRPDMRIAWEEPFGPVLPVIRIQTVEEGIHHCNASNFGLQVCKCAYLDVEYSITLGFCGVLILFCVSFRVLYIWKISIKQSWSMMQWKQGLFRSILHLPGVPTIFLSRYIYVDLCICRG